MKHSSKAILTGISEVVLGLVLLAVATATAVQAGLDSSPSTGDVALVAFLGFFGVLALVTGVVGLLAGVIAIGVRVGMADHDASYASR